MSCPKNKPSNLTLFCYPFAIRLRSVFSPFAIPSFCYPFSVFNSVDGWNSFQLQLVLSLDRSRSLDQPPLPHRARDQGRIRGTTPATTPGAAPPNMSRKHENKILTWKDEIISCLEWQVLHYNCVNTYIAVGGGMNTPLWTAILCTDYLDFRQFNRLWNKEKEKEVMRKGGKQEELCLDLAKYLSF